MMKIGKPERVTQDRVIKLFHEELGYRFLGNWADRAGNSNIDEKLLREYLIGAGYSHAEFSAAHHKLTTEVNDANRDL